MKSLLEQNKEFIIFLNKLSKSERNRLLGVLGTKYINTISEIFHNFLKQNLTSDTSVIKRVKPYKNEIRAISRKRLPIYKKRVLLQSKKGGSILSVLLPIASSLITSLFSRRR